MKLSTSQVKEALQQGGQSLDFRTGKPTTKRGFFVSIKDTETTINNARELSLEDLTARINEALTSNVYNEELNRSNVLGLWINEDGRLFLDVSKCLHVGAKDIYKVKNEAFVNNQYEVYNNETGKSYKLIIPIYTLYNTADLLGRIKADRIANYSQDYYNAQDIADRFNVSKAYISQITFDSIEDIPSEYNQSQVIIRDTSNYTRDILEDDPELSIEDASKLSRLIEA